MKSLLSLSLVALFLLPFGPAAAAEKEPLVDQVNKAVDEGVRFLKDRQKREGDNGHWEVDLVSRKGGATCLALLALLYSGEDPKSDTIQRGLRWLRDFEPADTYVVGLQTMVFAEARQGDGLAIQRNVTWLLNARVYKNEQLAGWGYHQKDGNADNSNTQYALLGLHAGKTAGARIKREDWEQIRDYYIRTQSKDDGGWPYRNSGPSTLTMSTAGLCGLLISGMEAAEAKAKLLEDGRAENCGEYAENEAVARALRYMGKNFTTEYTAAWFYSLYGIERAGRLSGQRFFGEFDWYRRGCETLVSPNFARSNRHDDGAWYIRGSNFDGSPVVSTSFALLFLSKGRTPVLISKLVHHSVDNPNLGWNNKHSDALHLVEYVNKLELFKERGRPVPVAWQVFNARQTRRNDADGLAAELLQTPIAYFNGHKAPIFTDAEEKMLQQYVEQGGFIFAEACCGSPEFETGFKDLAKRLWPGEEHALKRLPPSHPIYTAYFPLAAANEFPLYGIEFGCKTLVVLSTKPIAGYWETNQNSKGTPGEKAFQLGANVVAYATGLEVPRQRGTEVDIIKEKPESDQKRGYLKVAQLKNGSNENDRFSNQGVTRNLLLHMQKTYGLDVSLQTEPMSLGDRDLLNYKFLYMHGREKFDFKDADLKMLKANLDDGGLLFADACCGKKMFDESFRKMIEQMYGKNALVKINVEEELDPADPKEGPQRIRLYSKALNGTAITTVKRRTEAGKGYESVAPDLEGVKVGDRWVVIYSRYDIGCALEKHQSTDCLGHDYESALKLGAAVIQYAIQY